MHEVFTPRTLFLYRKDIIDQFKKVMGDVEPDLSLNSVDSAASDDKKVEKFDTSTSLEDVTKKKKKVKEAKPEVVLNYIRKNDTPLTRAIIKYWILRARFK